MEKENVLASGLLWVLLTFLLRVRNMFVLIMLQNNFVFGYKIQIYFLN